VPATQHRLSPPTFFPVSCKHSFPLRVSRHPHVQSWSISPTAPTAVLHPLLSFLPEGHHKITPSHLIFALTNNQSPSRISRSIHLNYGSPLTFPFLSRLKFTSPQFTSPSCFPSSPHWMLRSTVPMCLPSDGCRLSHALHLFRSTIHLHLYLLQQQHLNQIAHANTLPRAMSLLSRHASWLLHLSSISLIPQTLY
jgi:hypothetical protein